MLFRSDSTDVLVLLGAYDEEIAQQTGQSDHGTAAEPAGKRPSTAAKGSAKAVRGRNSPVGRGVTKRKSRGKE